MVDHDAFDATELASAYLDGEVTEVERARVEGDRVHVTVAHPGDRPGAERDLTGDDRQEVRRSRGDEEDEEVLTHGPGSPLSPRRRARPRWLRAAGSRR